MSRLLPRIIAIHDLSGFGRGSLTTVMPVLSAMGVQVCPVPTAILSTHTAFSGFSFLDTTASMSAFLAHWKDLGLRFDAIYSGFLGSPDQALIVQQFIDQFARDGQPVLIDPVMGDNGQLYDSLDPRMVGAMRRLIVSAAVITPNYTEACLLLNEKQQQRPDEQAIRTQLKALSALGPKQVIITSVPEKDRSRAIYAYDRMDSRFWKVSNEFLPVDYPGTGDAFASVLLGSLLGGDCLPIALDRADQFVSLTIRQTFGYSDLPPQEGVVQEKMLPLLLNPPPTSRYSLLEWA